MSEGNKREVKNILSPVWSNYFYPWGKLPRGKKEYDWTGLSLLFGSRSNKTLSVGKKGG